MKYPSGQLVRERDVIWWNEGCGIGRVAEVLEDAEAYTTAGLDEPSIIIDPKVSGPLEAQVIYPASCFDEEGMDLLTPEDFDRLNDFYKVVRAHNPDFIRSGPHAIEIQIDGAFKFWHLHDWESGRKELIVSENEVGERRMVVTLSGICYLKHPVVIVAPDGWIEKRDKLHWEHWRYLAVRKYSRIGFIVICIDGSTWILSRIKVLRSLNIIGRAFARVTNRQCSVGIDMIPLEGGVNEVASRVIDSVLSRIDFDQEGNSAQQFSEALECATDTLEIVSVMKRFRLLPD